MGKNVAGTFVKNIVPHQQCRIKEQQEQWKNFE